MASRPLKLRADYLFPGNGEAVPNAVLVIERERIVEIRTGAQASLPDVDVNLGPAAIIPPLANAHTHLEFSDLSNPLPPGSHFAAWIEAVIADRDARQSLDPNSRNAIQRGLAQTRRFGCLQIGEIATSAASPGADDSMGVRGVQFLELLGTNPERVATQLFAAEEFLRAQAVDPQRRFRTGLSPHAPYSTSMALVKGATALARRFDVPVAMHLAETREELQLLASQDGPLADFLMRRNVWPPRHISRPTSVMQYLETLAAAPRALVIHGNYLSDEQRAFIAARPHMSIVYCPRTHAHFDHAKYPLAELIDSGARIALGTDSRASSPDLNIWAEAQFVAQHHTEVAPVAVLKLVTTAAAEALGLEPAFVQVGQKASFTVIGGLERTDGSGDHPFAKLLAMGTAPVRTWSEGSEVEMGILGEQR